MWLGGRCVVVGSDVVDLRNSDGGRKVICEELER